jgi:DNA-binding PadR family transcriptional regulator
VTKTRDSLGEVEHLILLAIVRLSDAAYGVTIRREIEERAGRDVAIGAMYTALERLERKGFVHSTLSDSRPERGGRARRHYRLKAAGATALRDSRERFQRMWTGISSDLKKARS